MENPPTTGTLIRAARYAKGLAHYRDADRVTEISTENWKNWETKGTRPSPAHAAKLEEMLGVDFDLITLNAPAGAADPTLIPPTGDETIAANQRLASLLRAARENRRSNG